MRAWFSLFLAMLAAVPVGASGALSGAQETAAAPASRLQYATVAGGDLRSILPTGTSSNVVKVAPFRLQRTPVTNGEFLAFVRSNPQWQRGRVTSVFADGNYLRHWKGPLDPGSQERFAQPVTNVSWFAARAFCESHQARLPSWYEWELAAAADDKVPDARNDPAWKQKILSWYSRPSNAPLPPVGRGTPNVHGLHDLHGLIWEWVEDFNALFVSADNREQGDPDLMKFCGAGALSIEDRENYAVMMRLAMLSALKASSTTVNVGFRCATAGEPVASSSVHQLDVPLETQDGRRTSFAATGGRVRIATLFYASCPMACPLIIDTLKGVERQLTPAERAGLDVLMVTIDPENDTPQALRKLATERRLDTTRWTLARTSANDVRKLSAGLDIAYRKLPDGSFNHASVLVLMDAQGREIARSTKVGRPDPELVAAVRGALKAQQAGVSRR